MIQIENISPNTLNSRLADIAGHKYEHTYSTRYDKKNKTYKKMHFIWAADKRIARKYVSIKDYRMSRDALVRNRVSIHPATKNTWVATYVAGKKKYACRSTAYEVALYGCLIKAFDGGEKLEPLHPLAWDRVSDDELVPDTAPNIEEGEDVASRELSEVTHRFNVEHSELIRVDK